MGIIGKMNRKEKSDAKKMRSEFVETKQFN